MIENRMMTGNRVDCLYRVSTDKQVDYNDKSQAGVLHVYVADGFFPCADRKRYGSVSRPDVPELDNR